MNNAKLDHHQEKLALLRLALQWFLLGLSGLWGLSALLGLLGQ
jgi:hypothetical protein